MNIREISLATLLLFSVISCNKEKELNSINPDKIAVSGEVADAKKWLESKYSNNSTKQISWDKAVIESKGGKEEIYLPFNNASRKYLAP